MTQSIIERADASYIAPQMVGPKLIKSLHTLAHFSLMPEVGALSPELLQELVTKPSEAVSLYLAQDRPPLKMLNLCQSMSAGATQHERYIQTLVAEPLRYLTALRHPLSP